jgi:1-acyl-sn-glycerol-3-phosphate acyltransferase
VYRVLKLSVWVLQASGRGSLTRNDCDDRARRFARDVIDEADVDLRVHGGDNLPPDRPFVYMSNHQSMFDIPVMWTALPAQTLRFVAKTELFKTPLWGRAMRFAEMIEIDRSNRDQAIAALERGADLIRSGVSVWIAPEGHRSDTGKLGPLKKGGFHLAKNAGVDIVPVAVNGTINVLPPHELKVKRGQRVDVVIGEPVSVANRSVDQLVAEIRRFFDDQVDQDIRLAS